MSSRIASDCLRRGAIVCVSGLRAAYSVQTSDAVRQVLVALARQIGFATVTVIEDRHGREGSRPKDRPAFRELAALLCDGGVGALLCLDARLFVRHGRAWRRLLDLCALSGTLLADLEQHYDPRDPSDRRALGLIGGWLDPLLAERAPHLAQLRPPVGGATAPRTSLDAGPNAPAFVTSASSEARRVAVRRLLIHKFRKLQDVDELTLWAHREGLQVPVGADERPTRWEAPSRDALLRCLAGSHGQATSRVGACG